MLTVYELKETSLDKQRLNDRPISFQSSVILALCSAWMAGLGIPIQNVARRPNGLRRYPIARLAVAIDLSYSQIAAARKFNV
jgi:hypothetical protein